MSVAQATVGAVVRELAARLREAGVASPRREAAGIVRDLAGPQGPDPVLGADGPAPAGLREAALQAASRRAFGEPIAYVTGRCGFRHLELRVDHRVLIPRPETEQLVDLVLEALPSGRVVDVGTGSGCIALSLATEAPRLEVTGTDSSPGALEVARENAGCLGLPVRLLEGDLLAPVRGEVFDAVVSNPPYLAAAEYAVLDRSVRAWEPELALVGGEDGMAVIRRLLLEAPAVLRPGGLLALEVDASRAALAAALARDAGWRDVAVVRDLFGRDRFVTARRGSNDD